MLFWIKVAFWIVEAIGLWRLYREITRVRASIGRGRARTRTRLC
jgi:hypothetical protein